MSTNLARGALVRVAGERGAASTRRSTTCSARIRFRATSSSARPTRVTAGSTYRLWTTLKVPQGYSLRKHAELLARRGRRRALPADAGEDALHAGRRSRAAPRTRTGRARRPTRESRSDTEFVELSALEWRVLTSLKREFAPDEIVRDLWRARAAEAGVGSREFVAIASELEPARRDRAVLDLSRTRQSDGQRRTRDALQRALSLGGAAGPRDATPAARSRATTSSRTPIGAKAARSFTT